MEKIGYIDNIAVLIVGVVVVIAVFVVVGGGCGNGAVGTFHECHKRSSTEQTVQ